MSTVARRYVVSGRVQGVFFRASTRDAAVSLGLSGHALNRPDGRVEYRDVRLVLDSTAGPLIIGRGKKADVVVDDAMASREHARIECRRGKFVLTDMSTNGTYLITPEGPSYLRREELVLTGEGRIALGRQLAEATEVVRYRCD